MSPPPRSRGRSSRSRCSAGQVGIAPTHGEDWLPISQEDLTMTQEPKAPGAAAVYLYRQVDGDDTNGEVNIYVRLKILTEEGRKYADVEIPFVKGVEYVRAIEARTAVRSASCLVCNAIN